MEGEDNSFPFAQKKVWKFDPHYWNGQTWYPATGVELSLKLEKKELTVLSYNVWFGNYFTAQRMAAIGRIVEQKSPDVVCLQEVTPTINLLLLAQSWTHAYYVSDPEGKELVGYGVMILSKYRFHELMLRQFPTKLGRKALLGTLLVKDSPQVVIATFHLESYPEDVLIRQDQMKLLAELTADMSHVIICGDTNIAYENEDKHLGDRFGDAWKVLHQSSAEDEERNPGSTFDTVANSMTKKYCNFKAQNRIDRLYYTHATIRPLSMEIIGTQPIGPDVFPSDHFGIFVTLQL